MRAVVASSGFCCPSCRAWSCIAEEAEQVAEEEARQAMDQARRAQRQADAREKRW